MRLNPNSPAVAGIEWFPTRRLPRALAVGKGLGFQATSNASESIATIWTRLAAASPGGPQVGLDIYDASSVGATEIVVGGISVPVADVAQTAGWEQSTDNGASFVTTGSAIYSFVDKAIPDQYSPSDISGLMNLIGRQLRYRPTGSQTEGHLTWSMANTFEDIVDATPGNSPVGRRVGWIEINVAAKAFNGASPTIDGWIRLGTTGGQNYGSEDGPKRITEHWARYTWRFYWNPLTKRQWNTADIATFLSGATNSFGLSISGPAGTDFRVGAVNIVWRSLPEHRVATAYSTAPTNLAIDGLYCGFVMLNRDTGATLAWSKTTGHEYLYIYYMTGSGGAAALNGVDQASLAEDPTGSLQGWVGADQPTIPNSMVPNANAVFTSWAPSVYMEKASGGGLGVDFQAYALPTVLRVAAGAARSAENLAPHATATYGQATIIVGMIDPVTNTTISPDGPLVLQIRTVTGNTAVGGTISIDPSEVPADGLYHKVVRHFTSSASLLSGTQYYIEFTTTSTVPWSVGIAFTLEAIQDAGPNVPGNAVIVGVNNFNADWLVNVSTVPAAPTGFTATVASVVQSPVAPGASVRIYYAHLDWTSTALGSDFLAYEVQRSDDGTTWFPIAQITLESSSYLNDWESKRNVSQRYRVRVVRADGATSDWSL